MKQIVKQHFHGTENDRGLIEAEIQIDKLEELPEPDEFEGKRLIMGSQCWVIGTGDLYGLTSTGDWVKVNFMGNGEGGGGGGGFTPTGEQLTAMNSGIDSEKVAQIATNAQNISDIQTTIGNINAVLEEVL